MDMPLSAWDVPARKSGVVLSHASTMVGPLVTAHPDPHGFKDLVERLQPGVKAEPVWDDEDGMGWRTVNGFTPEQMITRWVDGETS